MKRSTGLLGLAAILMAWHFDGSLPTPMYVGLGGLVVVAMLVQRAVMPASTVAIERAALFASTDDHERARIDARTVKHERATHRERTETPERAGEYASTMHHERAENAEPYQRAAHHASTESSERNDPTQVFRRWLVVSGMHDADTRAATPEEAMDALRTKPVEGFGLMTIALPYGGGEVATVRTSKLLGRRWKRPLDARILIGQAVHRGLPDTSKEDIHDA